MDISFFVDKSKVPMHEELKIAIGSKYNLWAEIVNYAHTKYPSAIDEWNYPGKNYGWSFRVKDKKRAIIYLLPRVGFFKIAFVFGQKAYDSIMSSDINAKIKQELSEVRVYMEGPGIRVDVNDNTVIADIKKLIDIKVDS